MSREQDFITEARTEARKLWSAWTTLKSMQREYNALDYGNTLDAGAGENEGIGSAEVGAVIFATADAIESLMNAGHATNVAKLL